jgi:CHAT domain-containing protein
MVQDSPAHLDELTKLIATPVATMLGAAPAYHRSDVMERLKNTELDVLYLFCHADGGEGTGVKPRLRFGPIGGPEDTPITADDIPPDQWTHGPLIILNGCRTGAFRPDALSPLILVLGDKLAAGMLATEIDVDSCLAREVGRLVLAEFLRGERIAAALLTTRKALLAKHNPLGLAYTLFADGDLHLENPHSE